MPAGVSVRLQGPHLRLKLPVQEYNSLRFKHTDNLSVIRSPEISNTFSILGELQQDAKCNCLHLFLKL
jgi:hypothetical protein